MSYASWQSTSQSPPDPQILRKVFDDDTDSVIYSIGQEEDFDAARQKALKIGAKECYIVRASPDYSPDVGMRELAGA